MFHAFPKNISPKVNVIERLEFEQVFLQFSAFANSQQGSPLKIWILIGLYKYIFSFDLPTFWDTQ